MNTIQSQKGISRIETSSTLGWYVRVYRNKKTYSKFFSDTKFGGKDKALEMALFEKEELSKMISKIPKKPTKRRVVTKDKRNTTGVLGVSRTSKKASNGKSYDCYTVSWRPEPKVQKSTSFSIKKYGEEKALEMAIQLRRKKINQIQ
ncbi:MAG: hypothetical protein ACPGEE_04230 [Opitutales bacterium]